MEAIRVNGDTDEQARAKDRVAQLDGRAHCPTCGALLRRALNPYAVECENPKCDGTNGHYFDLQNPATVRRFYNAYMID